MRIDKYLFLKTLRTDWLRLLLAEGIPQYSKNSQFLQ